MIKTNIMKSLRILMAVLFMSAVFVSCDSQLDKDKARVCEIMCEMEAEGADKAALNEELKKIGEKYGEEGDASDDDKATWEKMDAKKECPKCEGEDEE
tara:strand:- start:159 stop:452 length:294 start_codon:yes stop_codon:yes gene_type:complete